ncbi:MAG: hypothetical protein ACR2MP_08980, partial [Streptosporangiaceae bacterium]
MIAAAAPVARQPKISPALATVISLAASSGVRWGVMRTAEVIVLCRNSPVTASVPAIRANAPASRRLIGARRGGADAKRREQAPGGSR